MEIEGVVLSPRASADLVEIADHIASESGERQADMVVSRISRTLRSLAYMPAAGRLRPDLRGSPRSFAVRPWIVLYRPQQAGGIIVIRIIDGRRDLPRVV
jgi:toxin ParE1/3/4